MSRSEIIALLKLAVELACDGGPTPFSTDEYNAMYSFLDNLETTEEK